MFRALLFIVLLFSTSCVAASPPNIIVIMTDDQRWDTITPQTMPATWNRLVQNGVTFTNSFVTTGLCCPSRISFLTGNLASRHGVKTVKMPEASIGPDSDTLATRLQAAGYRTGLLGKYVQAYAKLGPPNRPDWYIPPGWNTWAVFAQPGYLNYDLVTGPATTEHYGFEEMSYSTDVLATKAEAFVSASGNQPFFLLLTPYAPHEGDSRVPVRYAGAWTNLPPWRPPSFNEADVSDKGSYIQAIPLADANVIAGIDENRIEQYESLLAVDDLVRRVFLAVPPGKRSNTIFVFTSDNGFNWGEHRLRHDTGNEPSGTQAKGKNTPYDEAHRVPLIIRYGKLLGLQARTEAGFVTNEDVCASLAEWAGIPIPGQDGISFASYLVAGLALPRFAIPLEAWNGDLSVLYTATITATEKFIQWGTGETEHYNRLLDPHELDGD